MEFAVYILYSWKSDRNYTGFTNNLIQLFYLHNIFGKDSTRLYRPWIVVHVEFFDTRQDALKKKNITSLGADQ